MTTILQKLVREVKVVIKHRKYRQRRGVAHMFNADRSQMSSPPPLPKRHTQVDRPQDTPATAILSEPTRETPPVLPSRSKTSTADLPLDTAQELPGIPQPSKSSDASETTSARFVAPLPGTATSAQSRITGALRTVLALFPSQRPDTPEEAAIRRRLEEEQIARYMNSFSKHVQYLRMDPDSATKRTVQDGSGDAGAIRQKPTVEDFRLVLNDGQGNLEGNIIAENGTGEAQANQPETQQVPIDWFGYYAAVCVSSPRV